MRTNNGVEIIKNEFKAYLSMHVIQHQKTIPYTSQQNGVSERNNRTLIEMSRCMLYALEVVSILALVGSNYLSWKKSMVDELRSQNLWRLHKG